MSEEKAGLDLAAWRAAQQEGEHVVLPSGLGVYLKRVGLMDLAERGEIPAPMVALVEGLLSQKGGPRLSLKDFQEYAGIVNLVVMACALTPAVAEEPGPEVLGVQELPMVDRISIFNWANLTAAPLRPFR